MFLPGSARWAPSTSTDVQATVGPARWSVTPAFVALTARRIATDLRAASDHAATNELVASGGAGQTLSGGGQTRDTMAGESPSCAHS